MDKTKWSERDLEEFEKLCAPLVEFIQQRHDKCNPYSWIIIQWDGVAFMPDSFWFPFKVPDLMDKIKCPHCEAMVRQGNFCELCSGKLHDTCDCWVLGKPFNCGQPKCPPFDLLILLRQQQDDNCRPTCKNKQTFTGTLATTLDGNFIVVDKNSLTTL